MTLAVTIPHCAWILSDSRYSRPSESSYDFACKAVGGSDPASRLSESLTHRRAERSASFIPVTSQHQSESSGLKRWIAMQALTVRNQRIVLRYPRVACIFGLPVNARIRLHPWSLPGDSRSPFQPPRSILATTHNVYYVKSRDTLGRAVASHSNWQRASNPGTGHPFRLRHLQAHSSFATVASQG
jgi:hypothetical protein